MPKELESRGGVPQRRKSEVKSYDRPSEGRFARGVIRLDFNERPKPPDKRVKDALHAVIDDKDSLQVYPDYNGVNEILAAYVGVKPDQVLLTNGSDDAITTICRKTLSNEDMVVIPGPTFSTLEDEPRRQRAEIISPRPTYKEEEGFVFPYQEVMNSIRTNVRLVIICNPNNPTGTAVSKEQLLSIMEKAAEVSADVLVDEAYHEFAPQFTSVDLVPRFSNLYVTRSLSKVMGIAGLRPGYIVSQAENIKTTNPDDPKLDAFQNPYAVNRFAVASMKTLKDPEVIKEMEEYVSEVMKTSKPAIEEFYKSHDIRFFPSEANFHLLRMPKEFVEFMKSKGIFVRIKKDLPGMVRVSIGTREDTRRYLEALQEYLKTSR